MKFQEPFFRALARRPDAYYELLPFRTALASALPNQEFVTVLMDLGDKLQKLEVDRPHLEDLVKWIDQERDVERQLLEHIKPRMRNWIIEHQEKMVERLRLAIAEKPEHWDGVTIVWEIETPDHVPVDIAVKYVDTYGGKNA